MSKTKILEKIADSELEVLKLLWQAERALTFAEIRKSIIQTSDWELSTIKTLLYRLCDKGAVGVFKDGTFTYAPLVSEREYNDYATQGMINRLYGGSAKSLVASLIGGNRLTDGDIAELREMFKVGERDE